MNYICSIYIAIYQTKLVLSVAFPCVEVVDLFLFKSVIFIFLALSDSNSMKTENIIERTVYLEPSPSTLVFRMVSDACKDAPQGREATSLIELLNFLDRSKDGLSNDKEIKQCIFEILNLAKDWHFNYSIQFDAIENLDVFTAIWKCNDQDKISWIALLLCFFSIFPNLRSLLIDSIDNWDQFLAQIPDVDDQFNSANLPEGNFPGFYTVMESLSMILNNTSTKTRDGLNLQGLNLKEVLLHGWLPIWKSYGNKTNAGLSWSQYQENNQLSHLWKDEMALQFSIAMFDSNQLDINNDQVSSYAVFIKKLYKNILLINHNWIDPQIYQLATRTILNFDSSDSEETVKFNLTVIMEVIDHPEFNFIEESKLVLLLFFSLSNLINVKANIIHSILSKIGTTQTLLAMYNITEFLIARYINDFQNNLDIVNGVTDNISKFKFPKWFANEMLPPIPPISKSLFIFDSEEDLCHISNIEIIGTLFRCLLLINKLKHNLLTEYYDMYEHLNLIELDSECESKYLLKEQFLQLNYIPLFTTLLTSNHLSHSPLFQLNYLGPFLKESIPHQSIKVLHLLLKSYDNIALYHFLKFIDKISNQNLILQKISINLLSDVFYFNKKCNIINICKENELSLHIVIEYIKKWNDGTGTYKVFYDGFIKEKQPHISSTKTTLRKLLQQVPDYEHLLIDYDENIRQSQRKNSNTITANLNVNDDTTTFPTTTNTTATNTNTVTNNNTMHNNLMNSTTKNNNTVNSINSANNFNFYKENEPISVGNTQQSQPLKTYIPNKYDAYSSSVFVPSGNVNSNNNNITTVTSSFTPQLQQALSYQSSNLMNNNINNDNLHNNNLHNNNPNSMTNSNNNGSISVKNTTNTSDYSNDFHNNYHDSTNTNRINTNQHNNNNNNTNNTTNINNMDSDRSFGSTYSNNFGFTQSLTGPSPDFNHSTPNTPLTSNSNRNLLFSSHWNDQLMNSLNSMNSMSTSSPIANSIGSTHNVQGANKIVNTGKNYILGGHNRVKNNSRQQSIHIDQFENSNF